VRSEHKKNQAFTVLELAVVITVMVVISAWLLPGLAYTKPKAERLNCSNNLKLVAIAFRSWAADHNGQVPMSAPYSQGGDSEDVGVRVLSTVQKHSPTGGSRGVSMMFLSLSNYLGKPHLLFCPAEYEINYRKPATTFAGTIPVGTNGVPYTNDLNVSYFIGVDATEAAPRMLLAGDHNLGGNGNPPTSAYLSAFSSGNPFWSFGTNFNVNQGPAWMDNMHGKRGNVAMADGQVEWFDRTSLQEALKRTGDMGRTPGVFALATGANSGMGCNRIQLP
jgi:prepilin-type processing-associated H-X9-DG protein